MTVINAESIAKRLSSEVIGQRIYKAKVSFTDVDKSSPEYSKVHRFSANYHDYSVVDGEVSYLPEEAYSALKGAVYKKAIMSKAQEKIGGVDHDNPDDRYVKQEISRFDVTILDEMELLVDENGVKYFKSLKDSISEAEKESTIKAIVESEKERLRLENEEILKEERQKMQDEHNEKLEQLKAEIPAASDDKEIDDLLDGDNE